MVTHSFGCFMAIEVAAQLEKLGYECKLYSIDGSPKMMKDLTEKQFGVVVDDELLQGIILSTLINQILPLPDILKHKVRY